MLSSQVAYRIWSLILKLCHCYGIMSGMVSGEVSLNRHSEGNVNLTNRTQHDSYALLQSSDDFTVEYFVSTRTCPGLGKPVYVGNLDSLQQSGFEPRNPTRIIVHGWIANRTSPINIILPTNYHRIGEYNIIVVDWSEVAWNINYLSVRMNLRKVARRMAQFVNFLCSKGSVDPRSIYLIGHSIGAHLCGITARFVKSYAIGVIVGLDPAGPLFTSNDKDVLSASDAHHVQSIHSSDSFGFVQPIGHASFYLNGGRMQPGCGSGFAGYSCSHNIILEIFGESIDGRNTSFPSNKCRSLRDVDNGNCMNGDSVTYMGGEPVDANSRGVFYVKTNSNKPFGVSKNLPK